MSLHVDGELHLRVDAALDDEVAGLLERQGRLLAGLLVAGKLEGNVVLDQRLTIALATPPLLLFSG